MRSCAFGTDACSRKASTSSSSPTSPAAGSAWPNVALTPLAATRIHSRAEPSTTAAKEPISIGSPSDVPVPCISANLGDPDCNAASANAATRRLCCARPLGAVRLADLPSCWTALPSRMGAVMGAAFEV